MSDLRMDIAKMACSVCGGIHPEEVAQFIEQRDAFKTTPDLRLALEALASMCAKFDEPEHHAHYEWNDAIDAAHAAIAQYKKPTA